MKPASTTLIKPQEILRTPACEKCGRTTRFVGLEADSLVTGADLCTYECIGCQHVQVTIVARANGHATVA